MEKQSNIIDKLNRLRLERNLSVYRLAELSGLNQSTLANTFSRGTVPSIQNLELICEAMGITVAQFFTENESSEVLTPDEKELLENYRQLPSELKKSIKDLIAKIKNSSLA